MKRTMITRSILTLTAFFIMSASAWAGPHIERGGFNPTSAGDITATSVTASKIYISEGAVGTPIGSQQTVLSSTTPAIFGGATVGSYTTCTLPTANKDYVNKTGIGTASTVGDLVILTGGTGAYTGVYSVTAIIGADSIQLNRVCHASGTDIVDGAVSISTAPRLVVGTNRTYHQATLNNATGNEAAFRFDYTTNKAAGNDTGLQLNQTDTASPGTSYLMDLQVGGATKFNVENTGSGYFERDLTVNRNITFNGKIYGNATAGNPITFNNRNDGSEWARIDSGYFHVGPSPAAGSLMKVNGDGTTSGLTFYVNRNLAAASTDSVVAYIRQQNAGDDQHALQIDQLGSAAALNIKGPRAADILKITSLETLLYGGIGIDETGASGGLYLSTGGSRFLQGKSNGGVLIGTGYMNDAAPSNGLLVEGSAGIGDADPGTYKLKVNGTLYAGSGTFNNLSTGQIAFPNGSGLVGGSSDLFWDDSGKNLRIGGSGFGTSAAKVLGIGSGTAPTSSPADMAQLWAEDVGGAGQAELRVRDELGNVTTLSPHNFGLFQPDPSYALPWSYYSKNAYIGKEINVDMYGAIAEIERLSGKKFIYVNDIPKVDWDENQERNKVARDKEIQDANDRIATLEAKLVDLTTKLATLIEAEIKTNVVIDEGTKSTMGKEISDNQRSVTDIKVPVAYVKKTPPQWIKDRMILTEAVSKPMVPVEEVK